MGTDKKKAAAIAAVQIRLWGLSGRQAMMQMGNLMQMKSFHGGRRM